MTPSDSDRPLPSTSTRVDPVIARDAVDRVLSRATELQSRSTDLPEVVSESRLLEIAKEVGIDPASMRQALAEERARLPMQEPESGAVLDALGPATVSVQRVVPGTPAEVLAKLDAWMPRMESLTSLRRIGDRMSWEPRHDPLGNFLRSFGMGGRKLDLVRLDQVVASVSAIDGERTLVRFDADAFKARRTQRTTILSVAFAMTVIGAGFAVPLTLLAGSGVVAGGIAALVAMAGGATLLSWRAIRRGYREMIDRTHLRLEQLLDELEQGGMQPPPSLARQVTQALLR